MHPYLTAKVAEEHRNDLLRQADSARLAALARKTRRQARAHVVVRVLQPDDRLEIRRLFQRLPARSRYLRYLAPRRSLPESSLRQLAAIDHVRHEAVGAFARGSLIGAAHYVVTADDPTSADICVEVADRRQHEGVATRLLGALALSARAHGITRFTTSPAAMAATPGSAPCLTS